MNRTIIAGTALLLAVLAFPIHLHPGRTDSQGGHTNHATGEYHFHHGHPEHQHTDLDGDGILDCPYNFSGSPRIPSSPVSGVASSFASTPNAFHISAAETAEPETKPSAPVTSAVKTSSARTGSDVPWLLYSLGAAAFAELLALLYYRSSARDSATEAANFRHRLSQAETKHQIELSGITSRYDRRLDDMSIDCDCRIYDAQREADLRLENMESKYQQSLDSLMQAYSANQQELRSFLTVAYGYRYLLIISGAPDLVSMDGYGKPHKFSGTPPKDEYTFYRSSTGILHTCSCHHSFGGRKINVCDLSPEDFTRSGCQVCRPRYPDMTWYPRYLHLSELLSAAPPKTEPPRLT